MSKSQSSVNLKVCIFFQNSSSDENAKLRSLNFEFSSKKTKRRRKKKNQNNNVSLLSINTW